MRARLDALVAALSLGVLAAGPLFCGARPPWVFGYYAAVLFLLAAARLILNPTTLRSRLGWSVWAPGLLALVWISALQLYAVLQGVAEREPALGRDVLLGGWLFAAAVVLGRPWGRSGRALRRLLKTIFWATTVYAVLGLLQRFAHLPDQWWDWTDPTGRVGGTYTNPNRFAVLLALGVVCGTMLLASYGALAYRRWSRHDLVHRQRKARYVLLLSLYGLGLALTLTTLIFTLSRLTVVCLALALGLAAAGFKAKDAWIRAFPRQQAALYPAPQRLAVGLLSALGVLALTAFAVYALSLTISGPLARRFKDLSRENLPGMPERALAMESGVKLLQKAPGFGTGLGTFEERFSETQPGELPGRWNHQHNDWLELAIEAGLPAALLALLASLAAGWAWWRALELRRRRERGLLLALGAAAIAAPLGCSCADFPLREPATAALFFVLAGALVETWCLRAAREPGHAKSLEFGATGRYAAGALALGLSGVFLYFAVSGATQATALWETPWRGRGYPPDPKAEFSATYFDAFARDPANPELAFLAAQSQWERFRDSAPEAQAAEETRLETLFERWAALTQRDYRLPWLRAYFRSAQGRTADALADLDLAVKLAPSYYRLRIQCAELRLATAVFGKSGPLRDQAAVQSVSDLALLINLNQMQPQAALEILRKGGAKLEELAQLWPGKQPADAAARAKFWCDERVWKHALAEVEALGAEPPAWGLAVRGRLALERKQALPGAADWADALRHADAENFAQVEDWMLQQVPDLERNVLPTLAESVARDGQAQRLTLELVNRLILAEQFSAADRALSKLVNPSVSARRTWAELCLQIRDRAGALEQARLAWIACDRSKDWEAWYAAIQKRVETLKP